jgi:hypothetical protein
MRVRDGSGIRKMIKAHLPIQCQVGDIHGWNSQGLQGCLLFGYQAVPGGDDTLSVELV